MEFILALIAVIIIYIIGAFVSILKLPKGWFRTIALISMGLAVLIPIISIITG